MSTRTLAIWTAAAGLIAATSVTRGAQAGNCTGTITADCDFGGVSVVIDDLTFGSQIVTCPLGCSVSATAAVQKFYSTHDSSLYDSVIVCPVFSTTDGARTILIDYG